MADNKPVKRPRTAKKASDAQLKAAIKKNGGVYAHIARSLGMSRQAVIKRIKGDEEMESLVAEAQAEVLDVAEAKLFAHVKRGSLPAIRFLLSRKGRDRGYGMAMQVAAEIAGAQVVLTVPDDGRDSGGDDGSNIGSASTD